MTTKAKRGNKFEVFPNGTLSIQNANVQDRGQYLCIAENQHGSDKLLVTLSVVAYPPRILEPKQKEITAHSGNTVEMKCSAEGRPLPSISWILANQTFVRGSGSENSRVLMQPDGTLIIKRVTVYDRGHYRCMASNPAGVDTITIKMQVIAAPPVILEEKRQHFTGTIGQNLKLPCTATGNPQPSVRWVLFDGTEVKPLQFLNTKLFMFSNGTLFIKNLAPSDSGNYECIATSSTGSERRVVNLVVQQKDTVPQIVTASPKKIDLNYGDQLLLNCSATGEPKPTIIWRLPSKAIVDQWHRIGNRILVLLNGTLSIESVTEKDAGDYLCVARNRIGDDLMLMKVSVTMKPAKIEHKQYIKKQVLYGNDLKVDCKASGSPLPEIFWSLPDGTMINSVLQADDSGSRSRRYIVFDNGTLYFNKIGIAEEGDYTCYAQNTLGKDEMKVHVTVVTAAPRIKQSYKTFTKVSVWEMAMFDCEAVGEPKPKILWLLPSRDLISASSDRYLLHVNGSLSISTVKVSDAGAYTCVARNPAGDDTKLYRLEIVSKPPIINGLYTNKTVIKETAVKHTKKQIECKAEGTPQPQIMWIMPDSIFLTAPYYGSRIVVHRNGTLEIRNVRASDTAEFICVARNDGGETVLVVQLEVTDMLRRPMFKNPFNEKIIARAGKTTILNCSADGNPPPEVVWLLPNGTRFSNRQRISKYQIGSNGTFIIYSPTREDAGKYRCAARNKVGYIEKLIVLDVGQKPVIITKPKGLVRSISGEALSLHCLSDGSPKPQIIWTVPSGYVMNRPQINGKYILLENGTLVVRETNIHDRGNYVCRSQNSAGEATITIPVIIIAYPPRITNGPPQSVHTRAGAPIQLNCMAIGIPKPEVTWELPNRSVLSTAGNARSTGSELLHPQGTLVIQSPKRSDSGTYRCIAKNHLGIDSRITLIQVI
nr:PREDICTED: immunoglobulin superfamily member 10 isoform X2 [Latimeria chalumnae]|eukprot:XP_005996512.1 PREDICTED: immunoglobulin superfamily member 10 isoform X2 [Latimeria chalumnae]